MKRNKIFAYIILFICSLAIPIFLLLQINSFMTLSEPYILIAIIGLILSSIIYNIDYKEAINQTKSNNYINTRKLMKWSGLTYASIGLTVSIFLILNYAIFSILYLITNNQILNPQAALSIMQGVGWIILFFVCIPLLLITPIVIIYNVFILLSDTWHFIFKHKISLEMKFLEKLENLSFLTKHSKFNLLLEVLGIIIFLAIFSFSLLNFNEFVPNSNTKFQEDAIRAQQIFSGAISEDINLDNLNVVEITDLYENKFICTRMTPSKIVFADGLEAEFKKTGKCTDGNCKIIIDLNGSKKPNTMWISDSNPSDVIELTIIENGKNVKLPDFISK